MCCAVALRVSRMCACLRYIWVFVHVLTTSVTHAAAAAAAAAADGGDDDDDDDGDDGDDARRRPGWTS